MRWSRFKQQMEGTQPQTRNPKTTAPRGKKRKTAAVENQEQDKKIEQRNEAETLTHVKSELERSAQPTLDVQAPTTPRIKSEPGRSVDPMLGVQALLPTIPIIKPEQEQALHSLQSIPNNVDPERMGWLSMNEAPHSLEYPPLQEATMNTVPEASADSQSSLLVKQEPSVKVEPRGCE